jgi:hypothetical protein
VKLTKEQLRRIIRETVNRKLHALNEAPVSGEAVNMGELTDALGGVMVDQLVNEIVDSEFTSLSFEMVTDVVDQETVPLPGRYEDVEYYAEKAVDAALVDPRLKDALVASAIKVIHNLMR